MIPVLFVSVCFNSAPAECSKKHKINTMNAIKAILDTALWPAAMLKKE